MGVIDRQLQRSILEMLAGAFPEWRQASAVMPLRSLTEVLGTLWYLEGHGLVAQERDEFEPAVGFGMISGPRLWRITSKGLDFLEDDGGLSAILNVTTVRLEADTLKALISAHVDALPAPAEEKSRIKDAIKDISADALKDVAKSLIDQAMKHGPQAYEVLRGLVTSIT